MALAAASLRTGPAAQPSLGDGYLGVQEGEPGAKRDQQTPGIKVTSLARRAAGAQGCGMQELLADWVLPSWLNGVCAALPGPSALVQPPHSTSPQALPGEDLLSQGQRRMTTTGEGDGWAMPTMGPEKGRGQGLIPQPQGRAWPQRVMKQTELRLPMALLPLQGL